MQVCIDNPKSFCFLREIEQEKSNPLKMVRMIDNWRSPRSLTFSGEHLSSGGKAVFSNAIQLSKSAIVKVWTYG